MTHLQWVCGLLSVVLINVACAQPRSEAGWREAPPAKSPRVVVLEYSFLDAAILAGISPVGVADDRREQRILPDIRQQMGAYRSVGLRGQPDLETIASLYPDLIIADQLRHQTIYDKLQAIAPTILLASYGAGYQELLLDARKIGKALGREGEVEQALRQHHLTMDRYAAQLQRLLKGQRLLFAVASHKSVTLHGSRAFASGVLRRLGLNNAVPQNDNRPYIPVGLEQLAGINPDWLLLGDYVSQQGGADILKRWQQHPVWSYLAAVNQRQIVQVDPNAWSLGRGILGAELIAKDVLDAVQR
ncbi:Fe(3+) dicitrate ABC transporter substrate-binding protein [Pontibacterium granulatum]|uniref:ABC transporter substrate-binding protein n=1 Tax=Pontibacterium granulatum TaxID=2036029 RepID=UPI00249B37FB|nr:Fe(3+) dicitrate ABC transporter substrate-binding protein [Pontibacterium granulatum]MDI3324540.1 Fe(3+) dicitrate ABC transporter substrate-binding protein [Pontibacterium granulatum]